MIFKRQNYQGLLIVQALNSYLRQFDFFLTMGFYAICVKSCYSNVKVYLPVALQSNDLFYF